MARRRLAARHRRLCPRGAFLHVVVYTRQTSALRGTADMLLDAASYGSRWVLLSPAGLAESHRVAEPRFAKMSHPATRRLGPHLGRDPRVPQDHLRSHCSCAFFIIARLLFRVYCMLSCVHEFAALKEMPFS